MVNDEILEMDLVTPFNERHPWHVAVIYKTDLGSATQQLTSRLHCNAKKAGRICLRWQRKAIYTPRSEFDMSLNRYLDMPGHRDTAPRR
jgi:hypothetical protein